MMDVYVEEKNMNVLKRINKLRLEKNWSVYRLSVESGIPQSTLTNMFNRETLPSITTLEMLCNAFGITLSEFFLEEPIDADSIGEEEFLELYNSLPDGMKNSICNLMREYLKNK